MNTVNRMGLQELSDSELRLVEGGSSVAQGFLRLVGQIAGHVVNAFERHGREVSNNSGAASTLAFK